MEFRSPESITEKRTGIYGMFFPTGFKREAKEILKLTLPIALTSVITFIMGPVSTLFCGHYSNEALSVVGLGVSVFNVFGMVFPTGMLTACDTFFSQTYGSKDKSRMGVQLQRAFILALCICIPSYTMFMLAEPILLLFKQPPKIAKLVDNYLLYMYPGFIAASLVIVFQKFVQAQNHVYAPLIIGFSSNALNALLHYVLLFRFDVGLKGSAISQSISYWTMVIAYIIHFFMNKWHKTYWKGFQKEAFSDWDKWFALAIPGLIMIGLEWWIFEIGSFIAGSYGQLQLSSQTIVFQLESIAFTSVPFGFGIAASIRTGQALGAGKADGPISTKNVGIIICLCFTMIFIVLFTFFRNVMPMLFTENQEVIDFTSKILPLLAIFQFFDAFIGVCGGIVRGAGMQYIGAIICIVGLYVIALPMAIALLKLTDYGIAAYWMSLCTGTAIEGVAYLYLSSKINWQKQVENAIERCKISSIVDEENDTQDQKDKRKIAFRKVMINKMIFFICLLALLTFGIVMKKNLNLRSHFGVYCLFQNDTYQQIPWYRDSDPIPPIPLNCTLFYP